jgi:hypothetical protein
MSTIKEYLSSLPEEVVRGVDAQTVLATDLVEILQDCGHDIRVADLLDCLAIAGFGLIPAGFLPDNAGENLPSLAYLRLLASAK